MPTERLQQIERLWLIFSHFETKAFVDSFVAKLLGPGWTKQLELSQPGALLFCYLPPWTKNASPGSRLSALQHFKNLSLKLFGPKRFTDDTSDPSVPKFVYLLLPEKT